MCRATVCVRKAWEGIMYPGYAEQTAALFLLLLLLLNVCVHDCMQVCQQATVLVKETHLVLAFFFFFLFFLFFFIFMMHLVDLNQECLLHLFSFLDKDSRRNLSLTCIRLREAFLDPRLWSLLHFSSPCELRRDNFVLGSSLRHLNICWHSSRVKVCNIEDWMKTSFQRDLCSKHERLVSHFLERVCHMCPNLLSLTLSGCGHITDHDVISVLRSCRQLQQLCLENCCRVTDAVLQAVVTHGISLLEVRVDFCRNITQTGLQGVRLRRPGVRLSAERSAGMIPDSQPEEKLHIRRALQKVLIFS